MRTTLRASALLTLIAATGTWFAATSAQSAPSDDACAVTPASPLVVNVRDKGAKGDGKTNDTPAIQRAIDAVGGTGGTVYVPDGTYMVVGVGAEQLQLRSNMTLKLSDHAILKVIPNGEERYSVLRVSQASDVAIVGGILQGDRAKHKGKKGEWGMGIFVGPDAKRVTIAGVTSRDMWGDGFYVSGATDVALCSVAAIHNRRQGLSIIAGERLLVTTLCFEIRAARARWLASTSSQTIAQERVANVRIENSKFIDNAGDGIMIAGKKGHVANVQIRHNVFEGGRPILMEKRPERPLDTNLQQPLYLEAGAGLGRFQHLHQTGRGRGLAGGLQRGTRHALRGQSKHEEEKKK